MEEGKGEKISRRLEQLYAEGRKVSPFWRTWFPFSTSTWIRNHLLSIYPWDDYVWHLWRLMFSDFEAWRKVHAAHAERRMKAGSYQNFCNYFYWLRRLGLVEFTRVEEVGKRWLEGKFEKRRYYRILLERKDDPAWVNPRRALWPKSWAH